MMTHATYERRLAHKRIEDKRGAYENRIKNSELGCVQADVLLPLCDEYMKERTVREITS